MSCSRSSRRARGRRFCALLNQDPSSRRAEIGASYPMVFSPRARNRQALLEPLLRTFSRPSFSRCARYRRVVLEAVFFDVVREIVASCSRPSSSCRARDRRVEAVFEVVALHEALVVAAGQPTSHSQGGVAVCRDIFARPAVKRHCLSVFAGRAGRWNAGKLSPLAERPTSC